MTYPTFKNILLTSLLLCSVSLSADETQTPPIDIESQEQHVQVGTRAADSKRRDLIRQRRAQDEEEAGSRVPSAEGFIQRASSRLAAIDRPFKLAPTTYGQLQVRRAGFPISCHWLVSLSDTNRSLEMEDGSHWEIPYSEAYIVNTWRREDPLVITPNYWWFSSYDYYITNKSTNTYVQANLHPQYGPIAFGPYSHWIVDIDYFGGHVYLENQMVWCVSPEDAYLLRDWVINDHIILGVNDSWFSSYDHILINVATDDHVRVRQY